MKKIVLKIAGWMLILLTVLNLVLVLFGRTSWKFFWMITILIAAVAWLVLPKLKKE